MIFDLGGVLIHWDPRLLYRKLLRTEEDVDRFLSTICTQEWNERQDGGRPLDKGIAELSGRFPEEAVLLRAWKERFAEMMVPMEDAVEVAKELHHRGIPLYALSKWGAETFEATRHLFPFLGWFRGIVVSGKVGLLKPDPQIFWFLLRRYELDAAAALFVDDHLPNVLSARQIGLQAIHFTGSAELRAELQRLGLLG